MKNKSNKSGESRIAFAIKAIIAFAIIFVLVAFAEVDNALRPPRIIPPGNTLGEGNIDCIHGR
jgi:hypothetical protein